MFIAYQPQLTDLFPYSMSVTEFLKTYVSFNSHPIFSTHFSNYVKNHITELLELTFSNCDDEYSKKAFIVLSTGDGLIARSLIDKYFFFSKSTEIFASCDRFSNSDKSPNNKTNIMKISRLASIFQNILMKSSNIDYEAVGFLAQILSYIDNSVVFDLLKTVCSNSNHKSIQKYINKSLFYKIILKQFNEKDITNEKLTNLLILLKTCLKNPIFEKSFANEEFLEIVQEHIDSNDLFLKNYAWQATSAICNEELVFKMNKSIEKAIDMLIQHFSALHMYHVCAMDFLGKAMLYNPDYFDETEKRYTCEIIIKLVVMFPNSSNLISSIFRLIRSMFHNKKMKIVALENLLPLIMFESNNSIRNSLSANSLQFLCEIEEMRKSCHIVNNFLNQNHEYISLYSSFLKKHIESMRIPYGGSCEKSVRRSCSSDVMKKTFAFIPIL